MPVRQCYILRDFSKHRFSSVRYLFHTENVVMARRFKTTDRFSCMGAGWKATTDKVPI